MRLSETFTPHPIPGHFFVIFTAQGWRDIERRDKDVGFKGVEVPGLNGLFVKPFVSLVHMRFGSEAEAKNAMTALGLFGISRAIVEGAIPKFDTSDPLAPAKLNQEWIDAPFILVNASTMGVSKPASAAKDVPYGELLFT